MASLLPLSLKPRTYHRLLVITSSVAVLAILSAIHILRLSPFFSAFLTSDYGAPTLPIHQRASESEEQLRHNPIYQRHTAEEINSWNQLDIRAHFRRLIPEDLPASPPVSPHDVCLFIGRDTNSWHLWRRRNSRSVCVTSPVCIGTDTENTIVHTSNFARSECRVVTSAYNQYPAPFDNPHRHEPDLWPCPEAQYRLQLCPWPNTSKTSPKPCVTPYPTDSSSFQHIVNLSQLHQSLFKGVTVVVPRYPFVANIYHFAAMISTVAHAVNNIHIILAHYGLHKLRPSDALEKYPLNLLFLTQRRSKLPWQISLETILINGRMSRVVPKGIQVSFITEKPGTHVCIENPVLLGQRGHVNAWPFPNSTEIALDGTQVPKDAIHFREDVYSALGINPGPMFRHENGALYLHPPPLVLGYARRAGRSSAIGMGVHAAGTVRRFSDVDEAWFTQMLTNETRAAGLQFRDILTTPDETFVEQVKKVEKVGFIVGIHGANLANCIFMRPMTALLEIFPANVDSSCYIAGSNSGLAYFKYEAELEASPQESGCSKAEKRCWKLTRQRMVKIGTERDRTTIRNYVRLGIAHLIRLNKDYPHGIPVHYDLLSSYYVLNDTQSL